MKLDNQSLLKIVESEFKDAMGSEGGEIAAERAKALDYYLSKPLGNEVEESDESKVVTSDVADVVDGIMPSMLRIFTTADNVVSFDPVEAEDIAQAEQESDYVNHVFFKENPSFLIMFFWIFDALLQKNGIVMAWWDERKTVTEETYTGLYDFQLSEYLDDPELEPVSRSEYPSEDEVDEQGLPVTLYDLTFRRVKKKGKASVACVPPNEYRISSDANSPDPSCARLVGRERYIPRSELVEMGFNKKQVARLKAVKSNHSDSKELEARKDKVDDQRGAALDKSQELILTREAYIKVDFDGDGISELRQVFTGGGELLQWEDGSDANEIVDRQPFHVICSSPLPHKHFGRSPAEKVEDVQETSTTLLRQVLNNLYHTNNPGHAVWENGMNENTLDDLLTTRVGRVVRFGRNPNESYAPMTVPFTAGATFPMLEYFDKVKRDRTGISSDGEGLSPESLKNIQTTVLAQSVDLSKMRVEMIARIFAETGFKSLFVHIRELLMKHQDVPKLVRLRNEWVPVHPSEWRERDDTTVNIGLGIGTREQNLLHLNAIWEKQTAMAQGGGLNLTVTPKNLYHTAAEIVRNANLKNPALYFTDPGDQLAPPPADEQQQLEQIQMEMEQRRQQLDAERNNLNQMKVQLQAQEQKLSHQREMLKLEEKQQQREDNLAIANERLRNELLKLHQNNPKLRAEVDNLMADTLLKKATAAEKVGGSE